MEKWSACVHVM